MNDLIEYDSLAHHGIKGQKWYVRRFQNTDGTLTAAGKDRYAKFRSTVGKIAASNKTAANVLDYANRKGVLDFLDSKASTPFSAIQSSDTKYRYRSRSSKDPIDFISNLARYSDIALDTTDLSGRLSKHGSLQSWFTKDEVSDKLSKGLDKAEEIFKPEDWAKALIDRNGQSVADKKIGMISKDARDIERAAAGKVLIDNLRSDPSNAVSQLLPNWYRTDFRGRRPQFTGQPYEYDTAKKPVEWEWDPVYNSLGIKIGEQMRTTKWKEVRVADISRPTKEFIKYHESLEMPTNYSHIYSDYSSIYDDFAKDVVHTEDYIEHHGIKGQHWGERRYQNNDGSLTPLGRVRYGIGKAKEGVSQAIAGHKEKRDAKLDAKLAKARAKQERINKKNELRELQGKKKKLKDMSDQEVQDMIRRYQNERTLKALQRDSGKSNARILIEDSMRRAAADAIGATTKAVGANIGQNIANAFDTKENKARRNKDIAENKLKEKQARDKLEGKETKSLSEQMKEAASIAENRKKAISADLEARAMAGDEFARHHIADMSNVRKGKWGSPNSKSDMGRAFLEQRYNINPSRALPSAKTQSED